MSFFLSFAILQKVEPICLEDLCGQLIGGAGVLGHHQRAVLAFAVATAAVAVVVATAAVPTTAAVASTAITRAAFDVSFFL